MEGTHGGCRALMLAEPLSRRAPALEDLHTEEGEDEHDKEQDEEEVGDLVD